MKNKNFDQKTRRKRIQLRSTVQYNSLFVNHNLLMYLIRFKTKDCPNHHLDRLLWRQRMSCYKRRKSPKNRWRNWPELQINFLDILQDKEAEDVISHSVRIYNTFSRWIKLCLSMGSIKLLRQNHQSNHKLPHQCHLQEN